MYCLFYICLYILKYFVYLVFARLFVQPDATGAITALARLVGAAGTGSSNVGRTAATVARGSACSSSLLLPFSAGSPTSPLTSSARRPSTGSACQAGVPQPSHVLLAMGYDDAAARGSLRLSLGHTSTEADVDRLLAVLPQVHERAARASLVRSR